MLFEMWSAATKLFSPSPEQQILLCPLTLAGAWKGLAHRVPLDRQGRVPLLGVAGWTLGHQGLQP